MNIEQELWYDMPGLLPEPISGAELIALMEMVNSDGWTVFKKIRDLEARNSACVALHPTSPPEQRQAHRAIWLALANDISFASNLKIAAESAEGKEKADLDFNDHGAEDAPVPSYKDFAYFTNKPDKQ